MFSIEIPTIMNNSTIEPESHLYKLLFLNVADKSVQFNQGLIEMNNK